jgi:hypothetical protein
MSKAYGGSAYSQFQSDLISEADTVTHPPNEVTRLAPLIFARLGEHERCRSSKLVLGKGADESFAQWLGRVQCE